MFWVFFICIPFLFAERTDILFHLHDAGETNALVPVIQKLDVDYLVVTSGISANLLESLPKEKLRPFTQYSQIEPKLVITGIASELQGEVLDFFNSRGVATWAYWDNFNPNGESAYFKIAHSVAPRAEILLLPCETLRSAFPNRPVRVVGHPTLDVDLPSKVILWIGGYGADYDEAYALFQSGMKQVENALVIVQHHPKTGVKNAFKLAEALKLVDIVVCHQSTVSFQALAAGKRVLHVIPEGQEFNSLPLQKGLAKKVSCVEDFAEALQEAMQTDVDGFFELMGIPENSTETCQKAILEGLH